MSFYALLTKTFQTAKAEFVVQPKNMGKKINSVRNLRNSLHLKVEKQINARGPLPFIYPKRHNVVCNL